MKWVSGGPDLPPELIQSVEDGRVVFFCGAGISYPAGLPTFKGLVEKVYEQLHEVRSELEDDEFKSKNYDRVLGLLERRIGPKFVRDAVAEILRLADSADVSTHRALLDLSTTRQGVCRLVTTNFDRGFEVACPDVAIDTAPRLPIPKAGSWNSVVHLHGRLCSADPRHQSLVLTSADFGAAYLTERWASRFLADLFRRFSVLFVGYSVNDPVVRYMMDAFEADRAAGESVGKAFVLVGCKDSRDKTQARPWETKGLLPLLYDGESGHHNLHKTLSLWADRHRQGLLGRESVIQQNATVPPARPFDENPIVSQVIWALSEKSGHVATVFSRLEPPAPIEWLPVLESAGLLSLPVADQNGGGLRVPLVGNTFGLNGALEPHPVSRALANWLVCHLDKKRLLDWVLEKGGSLHPRLRWLIRGRLSRTTFQNKELQVLWEVLASDAPLARPDIQFSGYDIPDPVIESWGPRMKFEILHALQPVLQIRPSAFGKVFPGSDGDECTPFGLADCEVWPQCGGNSAFQLVDGIRKQSNRRILAELADNATDLVRQAMELRQACGGADFESDGSCSDQPSIRPHRQNNRFHSWTALLELCRDGWHELLASSPDRARLLADRWGTFPYPIFRRLRMYAMAESELFSVNECLEYLLERDGWWLWAVSLGPEKFRLLGATWPKLTDAEAVRLLSIILDGPPRSMFRTDLSNEDFERISEHEVWRRVVQLNASPRELPPAGQKRLEEIAISHPEWKLPGDDRGDFDFWFQEGVLEQHDQVATGLSAMDDAEIVLLLGSDQRCQADVNGWRQLLNEEPTRASKILSDLGELPVWSHDLWERAVEILLNRNNLQACGGSLAVLITKAPNSLIEKIYRRLARSLTDISEFSPLCPEYFWEIWDTVQPYAFDDLPNQSEDPLSDALSTPAGHLTEALLNMIGLARPRTASDLAIEIWNRLNFLADGERPVFRTARVLLASRLAWLHSFAPDWIEAHMLVHFRWNGSDEAEYVWRGYLLTTQITPDLWTCLKQDFLIALQRARRFNRSEPRICSFFASICIQRPEWVEIDEARDALRSLDADGLNAVVRVVWKQLEALGDESPKLWKELIGPWLDKVWPKDHSKRDPDTALYLAMATTYSGDEFASAVGAIVPLLTPVRYPSLLVERLIEMQIAAREPAASLELLGAVVDSDGSQTHQPFRQLLESIAQADPALTATPMFRSINECLLRGGI